MKICILGRGYSLNKLEKLNDIVFDYVVVVNGFWKVPHSNFIYYEDPLIKTFLKKYFGKIIAIHTPCCDTKFYNSFKKEFNVIERIRTNDVGRESIGWKENFNNAGSLGVAIYYIAKTFNPDQVYICGLDFYQRDYYLKQTYDSSNQIARSDKVLSDFVKLFKFYTTIKFILLTYANLPSVDNVELLL